MKAASELYQIYLSKCQISGNAPIRIMEFLRERLSEEDYLNAEEILTDTLVRTGEEAFCLGCAYLPNLLKELWEE